MQEIINYTKFTFRLLFTPYGIVALLIFLGIYAVYLLTFQREHVKVSTFAKLISYPATFTYGLIMLVVANVLEKDAIQRIGLLIMFIPIIISFTAFIVKGRETVDS